MEAFLVEKQTIMPIFVWKFEVMPKSFAQTNKYILLSFFYQSFIHFTLEIPTETWKKQKNKKNTQMK